MAQRQTNMTKADMVNEIANRTGLSKAEIKTIIEEFLQLIKESILAGMSIQLRGFGTFFRKKKASKKARNISLPLRLKRSNYGYNWGADNLTKTPQ